MKQTRLFLLMVILFQTAQSEEIFWYSMDAGGGISANNGLQVIGIAGQADTAQMSANGITISAGYLPLSVSNDLIFKDSFE